MKIVNGKIWIVILLVIISFTACQVTKENTLDAFAELPLSTATQITLVVNRNEGSHCDSYIVEAIYYTPQSTTEFIVEMDRNLLLAGWEGYGQKLSSDAQVRYASYYLKDRAGLSIDSEVTPIYTNNKYDEFIDMDALQLLEGQPLDNNNPEDGYFLIKFYYHPYPPNDGCNG